MSLIKIDKKANQHLGQKGNFITIDNHKQELAGIKLDTVKLRHILPVSTIVGTVAIDEQQLTNISSRAKGRIDKLFVKASGAYVSSGNPLYSIYSEQLQADEKEYLTLLVKAGTTNTSNLTGDLLAAAKNKLFLWGLSERQIAELEASKKPSSLITFYSPQAGYISEVKIAEGMYVEEGTPLLRITPLKTVWVEAQVYSNELSKMANNTSFQISAENISDEIYNGVLVYNNPLIEEGKRVQLLRIRVENPQGKLLPGMLVSVNPKQTTSPLLAVPKSAVFL
jgi:Cu(I)/Ag(I) efflux system membrane fusion protein